MSEFQPAAHAYVPGIEYSIPRGGARPGVVTGMGIASVVIGSLTILGCFAIGGYSWLFLSVARISTSMRSTATVSAAVATPGGGPTTGPSVAADDGMSVAASKVISQGVHAFHPLAPLRRQQFEHFLQQAGNISGFVPDENGNLPDVRKTILEDRTMPPPTPGVAPTDVLVTAYGRIEIYDEGVAFMPSDGSPAMRTAIGTGGVTPIALGSNPAASGALKLAEAQQVVTALQTNYPNTLNAAQIATLTAALQKPGQKLVMPGTTQSQFAYAYAVGDGTTVVNLDNGQMTMDASGKELSQAQGSPFTPGFGSGGASGPAPKMNLTAVGVSIGDALLSAVLAVYLIVAGSLVLRQSLLGAKLHWIFVALKIPLAAATAIVMPYLWYGFFNDMTPAGLPSSSSSSGFVVFGIIMAVLGLSYPVILIFVLSSRSVRWYYHSVTDPAIPNV